MSFLDRRIHHFHLIDRTKNHWIRDWSRYPGLPFAVPLVENLPFNFANNSHEWLQLHWYYSFLISAVYVLVIFGLKKVMTNRNPLTLRRPTIIWSATLALFSLAGAIRCLPEFFTVLTTRGVVASFCDSSYYLDVRLSAWYLMFVWSKVVELGDTLFIVLRKQKLFHFHVVHHVLALCYSWFVFGDVPATARWMVNMNFVVHFFLYSYYTLKAMGWKNRRAALMITAAEIIQMLIGFFINVKAFHLKISGVACDLSMSVATAGFCLYSLFFALFLNYFIRSFLVPASTRKIVEKDQNNNDIDENNNRNNSTQSLDCDSTTKKRQQQLSQQLPSG